MITATSPSVLTPTNRQSAGTSTLISFLFIEQIPICRDTITGQCFPVNPGRSYKTIFPIYPGCFVRVRLPIVEHVVVKRQCFPLGISATALQSNLKQVNKGVRQSNYRKRPVKHSHGDWFHARKGTEPVAFCPHQCVYPHPVWACFGFQFVASGQRGTNGNTGFVPTLGRLGKVD